MTFLTDLEWEKCRKPYAMIAFKVSCKPVDANAKLTHRHSQNQLAAAPGLHNTKPTLSIDTNGYSCGLEPCPENKYLKLEPIAAARKMRCKNTNQLRRAIIVLAGLLGVATGSDAHPHVFVDGGLEFMVDQKSILRGISVIWQYDAFETMFILTDLGILSVEDTGFTSAQRLIVEENLSQFPDDFDGSVHLTAGTSPLPLAWPRDLQAKMIGDRLEISFIRDLEDAYSLEGRTVSAAFYEKTYFFAFRMTETPNLSNNRSPCSVQFNPFLVSEATQVMQDTLQRLSREETPTDNDIGAYFADRAILSCD